MERRAKIVATIGPASQDEQTIEKLILAGMNVARLNFSHGTHEDHAQVIQRLRRVSQVIGKPLCLLQDLQGPKIRVGELADGKVSLKAGNKVRLVTDKIIGDENTISVSFPELTTGVEIGGRILLDDGNLELRVVSKGHNCVDTEVIVGGDLKPHKGVNLPGARLSISALTPKDEEDLLFGLEQGVDMVALSFVRAAHDIQYLRSRIAHLTPGKPRLPIIAKLERPEALQNLEEIVHAADGVMVARGDLGVEMSPQAVPIAQKRIIECANRHGRLVITATQMLDSMINNPRPTRAEASDVANAVLDGTDAVMLSGETAAGKYPVQAVQMMEAIICQAEEHMEQWGHWKGEPSPQFQGDDTYYMTLAARALAHDRNVAAIVVFTTSGRTAQMLSKTRPGVPILAFSTLEKTRNQMALYWGVTSYTVPMANSIEMMIAEVDAVMVSHARIHPGQQVVLICGFPVGETRPTNMALLHSIEKR
jgi:pyruvate kinase